MQEQLHVLLFSMIRECPQGVHMHVLLLQGFSKVRYTLARFCDVRVKCYQESHGSYLLLLYDNQGTLYFLRRISHFLQIVYRFFYWYSVYV